MDFAKRAEKLQIEEERLKAMEDFNVRVLVRIQDLETQLNAKNITVHGRKATIYDQEREILYASMTRNKYRLHEIEDKVFEQLKYVENLRRDVVELKEKASVASQRPPIKKYVKKSVVPDYVRFSPMRWIDRTRRRLFV